MLNFKNIYLVFILFSFCAFSQSGIGSAKSLIKLEFEDMYGLNISDSEINLDINSIEKFNQGTQTNWLNSHLSVTGLTNFEISIKAMQPYFYSNNSESEIAVSNIQVAARTNSKTNVITLSDISQILISETNGGLLNQIDVKYQIPPENTFAFLNQTNKVFEILIIYTLIPN